jgi:hypothetical protein
MILNILTLNRSTPAFMLLASLAFADNWFLLSLFIVSLKHFHFDIDIVEKSEFICKLTAYSTFISSFLSIWYIFKIINLSQKNKILKIYHIQLGL